MTENIKKFQPMPKRFAVWDVVNKEFCTYLGHMAIFDGVIALAKYVANYAHEGLIIIQSTNLFDKDGKEIFDGSIVRGQVFDDPKTRIVGMVVYQQQAFWIINAEETHSEPLLKFYEKEVEVIGHILSNPGLLEKQ